QPRPAPGPLVAAVPAADLGARVPGRVAAAVAAALGIVAAVMLVAGHQPWDGPEVVALTGSHGLHAGDVVAVVPLVAGAWLAAWCLRRDVAA
ncbi:MAG: hypothetical protein KDA94_05425, partial [Acidimicrobiales bacterium]|nr:hypothetical protein [Acidimicrobiales bacterium]